MQQMTLSERAGTSLKLAITLTVILVSNCVPSRLWPIQVLLLAGLLSGLFVAKVSIRQLAWNLSLFLPTLLVLGLSIPITQPQNPAAWIWTVTLWLRCLVCFLAGFWLIQVMNFQELLITLQRWHVSPPLVTMLAFMYRHLFVLREELARLRQAREARDFGASTNWMRLVGNAQMIGLLLLRGLERAERSHRAMLARGWNGAMHFLGENPSSPR